MQALGDYGRARAYYAESMRIFRDMGSNNVSRTAPLIGFGELAERQGLPERAATLFGAAMAFVKDIAYAPDYKRADFERDIAVVRADLGEAAFARAWAEGQAMTILQAVAYALQDSALANSSQLTSRINQTQIEPLTKREHEVLRLVADGLSNAEIAQKLFLSVATIKVHTRNIYGKLGVNTRTQAIGQAQKLNLL